MMVAAAAGRGETPPVPPACIPVCARHPACFNLLPSPQPTLIASTHPNTMFEPPLQPNASPDSHLIAHVGSELPLGTTPYRLLQAIAHDSTPAQLTLGKELSRDEFWANGLELVALVVEEREWKMWGRVQYPIKEAVRNARMGRLGHVVPGDGIGSCRGRLEYPICHEGREVCYRCQVRLRGD